MKNLLLEIEKSPLSSKKFIAYMVTNLFLKSYLFYATAKKEGDVVIMTAIAASTFIDVGYLLGQAAVDALVRYTGIIKSAAMEIPEKFEHILDQSKNKKNET